jgi:hypothetical protein
MKIMEYVRIMILHDRFPLQFWEDVVDGPKKAPRQLTFEF